MGQGPWLAHRRYRLATLQACLAAAGISLAVFGLPLIFGWYYFGYDLTRNDLGVLCGTQQLLAAHAPLWLSPHLGNGAPLLARHEAQLLYPPRWLALALPASLGASLVITLHLATGAAAATWLGRAFRVRPFNAACLGLGFAFSGTVVNLIVHGPYVIAAAWLPLAWAAARRALGPRRRRSDLAWLSLALLALLLGGEPQSFCVASALVVLEVVWRTRRPVARWWRRSWPALAAIVAAFATAAVWWNAYWAEAVLSPRGGPSMLEIALTGSFRATTWPAVLLPGPLFIDGVWQLAIDTAGLGAWNPSPYLGSLCIVALVCGLMLRRARLLALVLAVSVFMALGSMFPRAMRLLFALLPPLGFFRAPQKYFLVATLAALVVAICFFDALAKRPALRRWLVWSAGPLLLCELATVAACYVWRGEIQQVAQEWLHQLAYARMHDLWWSLAIATVQGAAFVVLALLVAFALPTLRRYCAAFLVADVLLAVLPADYIGPDLLDLPAPLRALADEQPNPPPVLCWAPQSDHVVFTLLVAASQAWNQEAILKVFGRQEVQACDGLTSSLPYTPLQTRLNLALQAIMRGTMRSTLARALGCTHVVSDTQLSDVAAQPVAFESLPPAERAFMQAGLLVLRLPDPVPEVFVARGAHVAADEPTVLELIDASAGAAGLVAIIDDPLQRLPRAAVLPDGASATGVHVDWPVRSAATVLVDGSGGAVVGLRTSFQVGWTAEQGGRALPVVRSGGQQVAVVVEDVTAGPILFRYRVPRFAASVALAVAGAISLLALVVFKGRPRRTVVAT